MKKNGYVNFNFLDSKPNINNILVGLDLDYSNKSDSTRWSWVSIDCFYVQLKILLTIAPQFKTEFSG